MMLFAVFLVNEISFVLLSLHAETGYSKYNCWHNTMKDDIYCVLLVITIQKKDEYRI